MNINVDDLMANVPAQERPSFDALMAAIFSGIPTPQRPQPDPEADMPEVE